MASAGDYGSYVPSTNIWDVSQIQSVEVTSPEFKELLIRLYQNVNAIALSLNIKDSGLYILQEFANGQGFFPNPTATPEMQTTLRPVRRKVINFGQLPNAGTKSVAHGIVCNSSTTFTRIYGTASDTTGFNYIPLPYASPTLINNIELKVDATNVTIITGSNRSNFDTTFIILEYLQN